MAKQNKPRYVIPKFHFEVSWKSTKIACSDVSGLETEIDSMDYRTGDDKNFHTDKLPGLQKFGDVVLKKAIFKSDAAFEGWYRKVANRAEDGYREETVDIFLKDDNHKVVISWALNQAWVAKLDMPDMNSMANEPALESITIKCRSIVQKFVS